MFAKIFQSIICVLINVFDTISTKHFCNSSIEFLAVNCQYNFLRFHDNSENS